MPTHRDPERHADQHPDDGEHRRLPRDRDARLPPREPDRPQHREVVTPPPRRRHQRVRDGRAREQREEHTEHQREIGQPSEVDDRGRDHRGLREQVRRHPSFTSRARRRLHVGARRPPHEQVVLDALVTGADGAREPRLRHPTAHVVVGV